MRCGWSCRRRCRAGWEWWADVEEIARRLGPSAAWAEVVGEPLEARAAYFREALGDAVVARERE